MQGFVAEIYTFPGLMVGYLSHLPVLLKAMTVMHMPQNITQLKI